MFGRVDELFDEQKIKLVTACGKLALKMQR
jgi:hypothetical protein